ncbi:hypothetical protein HaLaN_07251 [Haematococcus lacustris]|uniref:Uncharacterized protein n=1 Tax=Haematococcus lacustris TaxID=44745 RepID=A0A699YXG9_HAELA|nr:hypothetical protein HaLaN_07251 [Haematococcus lacustris]
MLRRLALQQGAWQPAAITQPTAAADPASQLPAHTARRKVCHAHSQESEKSPDNGLHVATSSLAGCVAASVTKSEPWAEEGVEAADCALSWTPPLLLSAELLTAVVKLLGWPEAAGALEAGAIAAAGSASEVMAAAVSRPSKGGGAMPAAPLPLPPTMDHASPAQQHPAAMEGYGIPAALASGPEEQQGRAQAGMLSSAVEQPAAAAARPPSCCPCLAPC